ncbi:MAG: NADH-quinone oxidoreductase subunit N [Bacillota bacterium]
MDWNLVTPELIVAGTGLAVLVLDLFLSEERRRSAAYLSLAGLLAALVASVRLLAAGLPDGSGAAAAGPGAGLWGGMLVADPFALLVKLLFLGIGLAVIMLSVDFVESRRIAVGEYNALVLFSVLGMMIMAGSRDLIVIYLGLETTAIASYVLAGLLRGDARSGEAALKYFLTGALASAVILFGMSLVFGGTGSTNLTALLAPGFLGLSGAAPVSGPLALAGLVLLVAGFGFKIAAVPFHFWAPDAYEGAPTPVTAFFSVGPKAAAFAVVLRVFAPVLLLGQAGGPPAVLPVLFTGLAVVTMTVGNLVALTQKNIKRMLAYSSIAHAGYMMVGLAVATPQGTAAVIYYLLAYAVTNLGVFAVVIWLNNRGTGDEISDYTGLAGRAPLAAAAMLVCLLSLIGIPPMVGFFGKFYLFMAAVEAGMAWLAVVMVVNSAVSVGYYYGIVRNMYLQGEPAGEAVRATPMVGTALGLTVAAVLALGFLSEPLSHLARLAGGGL